MKVTGFTVANLALAFALELAAFSVLVYGAFNLVDNTALGVLLAVGTLVAATVSWGLFAAPRAPHRHPLVTTGVKAVIFAGAVIALAVNAHPVLSIALGVTAALNALSLHGYNKGSVRLAGDRSASPAAPSAGVTVVGWLTAAWCLGFATVNFGFEVTGHFADGPLAEYALGTSVMDWLV